MAFAFSSTLGKTLFAREKSAREHAVHEIIFFIIVQTTAEL